MTRPRLALRPGIVGWLLLLLAVGFVGAALSGSWQYVRVSVA